jgi:peptidoglycan-N-acetylglucosamine deacetylase
MQSVLDTHGYRTDPVSIDASDWYYSQRLSERLKEHPDADTKAYKDAYLRHLYDRAQYYDGLSRRAIREKMKYTRSRSSIDYISELGRRGPLRLASLRVPSRPN